MSAVQTVPPKLWHCIYYENKQDYQSRDCQAILSFSSHCKSTISMFKNVWGTFFCAWTVHLSLFARTSSSYPIILGLNFPWYLFSVTLISWWNLSLCSSLTSPRLGGKKRWECKKCIFSDILAPIRWYAVSVIIITIIIIITTTTTHYICQVWLHFTLATVSDCTELASSWLFQRHRKHIYLVYSSSRPRRTATTLRLSQRFHLWSA